MKKTSKIQYDRKIYILFIYFALYSPLNFGFIVRQRIQKFLMRSPFKQIVVTPIVHNMPKCVRIETIFEFNTLQRWRISPSAIELRTQIVDNLQVGERMDKKFTHYHHLHTTQSY